MAPPRGSDRRRRRRLTYERRITLLAVLAGAPGVALALVLLWTGDYSLRLQWTLTVLLVGAWGLLVATLRERTIRPIQTLANLLSALHEGDYSMRPADGPTDDALGLAFREVQALGRTLREQRLGALEATALLRKVMAEIDVAVFTFDHQRKLRLVNRAGERLMARPAERLLGRTIEELGLAEVMGVAQGVGDGGASVGGGDANAGAGSNAHGGVDAGADAEPNANGGANAGVVSNATGGANAGDGAVASAASADAAGAPTSGASAGATATAAGASAATASSSVAAALSGAGASTAASPSAAGRATGSASAAASASAPGSVSATATAPTPAPGPRIVEATFPGRAGRWEVRTGTFRQGGLPHTLLVLTDLSRTLREEERQAWQRLVRVLGHEINNSLAPIKSIAASLTRLLARNPRPADLDEDLTRGLDVIAARADALSRFMTAYARHARLPPPRPVPLSIDSLIRRVASFETRMPIEVEGGPDLTVHADADQLEQLLINLVKNAVEAAQETDGRVWIRWDVGPSGQLEIHVEDQGPGLPESGNLFVPFFTTKPTGSGIGLVLCRQIAEGHGGTLALENRPEGKGCRAVVRLPVGVG